MKNQKSLSSVSDEHLVDMCSPVISKHFIDHWNNDGSTKIALAVNSWAETGCELPLGNHQACFASLLITVNCLLIKTNYCYRLYQNTIG